MGDPEAAASPEGPLELEETRRERRAAQRDGRRSHEAAIVPRKSKLRLWWDWVLANALGVPIGLGVGSFAGWLTLDQLDERLGLGAGVVLSTFAFGIIAGSILGFFQHRVLRWPLPYLTEANWILVTIAGAAVAWLATSTAVTLTGVDAASSTEPISGTYLLVAAGFGLAVGAVVGLPQAMALSRWSTLAWNWLWAHSLAWVVGALLVYVALAMAPEQPALLDVVPYALGGLLVAGVVVGAIHGVVLVWLVGERLIPSEYPRHVMDSLRRIDPSWLDRNDR